MGALTKDRLIFDPADLSESDNIGSYTRAGSDGDLISSTLVSGKEGLDVYLINASVAVSATDFDIRDLSHTQDSIKIGDGTDFLAINADGSLNVTVVSDANDGIFAEDSVAANADNGQSVLKVRQDTLASSVSADGDYEWFKGNARGALWTAPVGSVDDDGADTEFPVKMGSKALSGALSAVSASGDRANMISDLYRRIYINDSPNIAAAAADFDVDNTVGGIALPTAALAGRRRMFIQNLGSNDVYLGPSGVTTTSGFRLAKGSTVSLELGQNVALFGISGSATLNDVRVFELA